ncbi:MAG: ABC transporter ATP-binding protein [Thermomicrobia bacterium]|nr:ABC transporter ATP-binding protein [Thermomicrobia bacterium]MCA1724437.1 ABC transporter ATP-binding protein [Thermomicrobia bacterium]
MSSVDTDRAAAASPDPPPENSTLGNVLLELRNVNVNYGGIQALREVNLSVHTGEIVTLIGANGAGKSTTLRTISRLITPRSGQIIYDGAEITAARPDQVVRRGIAQCPEGRRVLTRFSVLDNLEMGAYTRADRAQIRTDIERQFSLFPILGERRKQLAGTLSGGEQQMLAIARAVMSRPRLLLLDEPSLGLAPLIVRDIFAVIRELHEQGVTILLVEQNAHLALRYADRGYVLEAGRVTIAGSADELANDDRVRKAYLG